MLAGELKSSIRTIKGAPEIAIIINGGESWLKVQKASLLEALSEAFDRKNEETGIDIDIETCRITFEVTDQQVTCDLDDLLE